MTNRDILRISPSAGEELIKTALDELSKRPPEDMATLAAENPLIDKLAAYIYAGHPSGYDMCEDRFFKDLPDVTPEHELGMSGRSKAWHRRLAAGALILLGRESAVKARRTDEGNNEASGEKAGSESSQLNPDASALRKATQAISKDPFTAGAKP